MKRTNENGKPSAKFGMHAPDGTDAAGEKLPVVIRILPDGRLYTHDITAAMLPILTSLCPTDANLAARAKVLERAERGEAL